VGNYLQTLGGIYAVLLAFVVYAVWQQFNEARTQVEREANEVTELFRTTRTLPVRTRAKLHEALHAYCCGVVDREWQKLADPKIEFEDAELVSLLDALWRSLSAAEPRSEMETVVIGAAMQCFNELCNARSARLSTSRLRIPTGLRWLLYVGALILCCSTWLLAVDSFALHAFISGATAGCTAHVLYVIEDLDDCFSGDWQVPKVAFVRAREFMRLYWLQPEQVAVYEDIQPTAPKQDG
jgi:hypothetical protein